MSDAPKLGIAIPHVSDHRVTTFLRAACLPAPPRLAQAGRRRFDFPGFGPGGSLIGRSEAQADRGSRQAPACASHAQRSHGGQIPRKSGPVHL